MFLDRTRDRKRLKPYDPTYAYRFGFAAGAASANHLVQRIAMNVNDRSLFVTTSGYFGIDLVCVVLTAHVPLVFRPTSGREYGFVGDSYVHGISEGEMIPWVKANGKSIEVDLALLMHLTTWRIVRRISVVIVDIGVTHTLGKSGVNISIMPITGFSEDGWR